MLIIVVAGLQMSAKAQNRNKNYYNPYQAEAEYYREFNKRMTPVYNGARVIQRGANAGVNGLSRITPRYGGAVRNGYNAARGYIQRNVGLPRRYQYRG